MSSHEFCSYQMTWFIYHSRISSLDCSGWEWPSHQPEGGKQEMRAVQDCPVTSWTHIWHWALSLLSVIPLNTLLPKPKASKNSSEGNLRSQAWGGLFVYSWTGLTAAKTTFFPVSGVPVPSNAPKPLQIPLWLYLQVYQLLQGVLAASPLCNQVPQCIVSIKRYRMMKKTTSRKKNLNNTFLQLCHILTPPTLLHTLPQYDSKETFSMEPYQGKIYCQ